MSKLLEQIIRNILTEDSMVLGLETLQAEDVAFINSQIRTPLGIAKTDMNFYNLDGLRVTLKRVGLRDRDDVTGKRSREITPIEFQTKVVLKLNGLRGGYLPMTGPDYVWIITGDLKTNKKRDARRPKSDRIIAKYYSVATYIKTSLIPKTLTNTMKGYIDNLSAGALIFNLADVNFNEWTRGINIEPVTLANAPYGKCKFGDESRVVLELYSYFNLKAKGFEEPSSNKFGCDLKGAIQQFQTENSLPVTGDYDIATMEFATSLKQKEYIFNHPEEIKAFAKACSRENLDIVDDTAPIVVPAGGFKYIPLLANVEIKGDVQFRKVQDAMIAFCNKWDLPTKKGKPGGGIEKSKKIFANFVKLMEVPGERGVYTVDSRDMVGICKNFLQLEPYLIKFANTSEEIVDQQFVDVLILHSK